MLGVSIAGPRKPPLRVLCLGAHSDDIEIGCGGTILRLTEEHPAEVLWVVLAAAGARGNEARESADRFLAGAKGREVIAREFRDGYFPGAVSEIKDFFEGLKAKAQPDVIFTHHRHDLHQDHRLVSDLTWNTFRNHLILEYEIVKYDGDLGAPNVFVPLPQAKAAEKVRIITECFRSQAGKHWFTEDAFSSIMRLRGIECNAPDGRAEAFYGRKLVL